MDLDKIEKMREMAETEVSVVSNAISEMIDASGDNLSDTDSVLLQIPVSSNIFHIQRYELKLKNREVNEAQELDL